MLHRNTLLFICVLGLFSPTLGFALGLPSVADAPESITVRDKTVALKSLQNPLPQNSVNIREGGDVYIKNCVLCHGDLLDGNGLFADRFFPKPASFIGSASILTQPQSYAYWRIMKGGKGLPAKFSPWDSSMPAWENQLTEDEVWKVVSYICATATERNLAIKTPDTEPTPEKGKKIYLEKCAYCHGESGDGDGPSAPYSSPKPRNFTKGHIKLRTTPYGKLPTDQDIFDAITQGMRATTMPGWGHLPENDRWSLVLYLKSFSTKFEKFDKGGSSHKIQTVPEAPPFSLESAASGKTLFNQNCSGCHGLQGRSDGVSTRKIVDIETDAIWPRNLSKPWSFRRGSSRDQLFLTIRTGLSGSAMPRFSPRIFSDEQVWDIVNYVETLAPTQKPDIRSLVKVSKIDSLPTNQNDPVWNTIEASYFPLGGQIMDAQKSFHPVADSITLKAVHDGNEIALYMYWDDPSFDPTLSGKIEIKESPVPPLPPQLEDLGGEQEQPSHPAPQKFPDAVALQFPVSIANHGEKPYFLNGDADHPTNLWKWESAPLAVRDINATGLGNESTQPESSQDVSATARYEYGRYYLLMKRKLQTDDKQRDIQFEVGKEVPIAFNIWDGYSGENATRKAVSSWFSLILE